MVKKLLFIVVAAVVLGFIFTLVGSFMDREGSVVEAPTASEGPSAAVPAPGSDVPEMVVSPGEGVVVTYTNDGFSPRTVNMKAGEAVTFLNESSRPFWPASAFHPTHKIYPGSDIGKCGTGEADAIFDACKGINSGGSWRFKFDTAGTWKYHDHLNIGRTGTIVVE